MKQKEKGYEGFGIKMYDEEQNYDSNALPAGFYGPGRPKGFGILADDFHHYANSIYDRWDEGYKPKKKHMKGLLETCKAFIKLNKKWEENKK